MEKRVTAVIAGDGKYIRQMISYISYSETELKVNNLWKREGEEDGRQRREK
jgi:hypothetical protein